MQKLLLITLFVPTFIFGQNNFGVSDSQRAKAYITAIGEYIKAVGEKNQLKFDTLYIGKHEDLPEINFPDRIQGKKIMLLSFKSGDKIPQDRRSFILVNIIETKATKEDYGFLFITFFKDYHPQHNCNIALQYNSSKKIFTLKSEILFEYVYSKK